jgi:N-acetylglutamate synthase-like GNAT family acetyltransferase
MIEMMCIAIDSRAWRFSRIDQMINDLLIQAQNANWDINAILVHPI